MPSFLAQIQALDTAITQGVAPRVIARPMPPQIEPRSLRRKKARDAAKASQPMRSRAVSNNLVKSN